MSKYHVVHGTVVLAGDPATQVDGAPPTRREIGIGESFDMDDKEALPLLVAGTIGKGETLRDDEHAPVTNQLADDADKKAAQAATTTREAASAAKAELHSSHRPPAGR